MSNRVALDVANDAADRFERAARTRVARDPNQRIERATGGGRGKRFPRPARYRAG